MGVLQVRPCHCKAAGPAIKCQRIEREEVGGMLVTKGCNQLSSDRGRKQFIHTYAEKKRAHKFTDIYYQGSQGFLCKVTEIEQLHERERDRDREGRERQTMRVTQMTESF